MEDLAPDFQQYADKADFYLKREVFKGTPLTGQMLANSAQQAYLQTGVLVPVQLALAQGQFESHFGTDKNSKRDFINNPFNIGAQDKGNTMKFGSTSEGVDAYYKTMASDYLSTKDVTTLLKDFTNMDGNRYASNKNYESDISKQMTFIDKFIGAMDKAVQGQKQSGIGVLKQ